MIKLTSIKRVRKPHAHDMQAVNKREKQRYDMVHEVLRKEVEARNGDCPAA